MSAARISVRPFILSFELQCSMSADWAKRVKSKGEMVFGMNCRGRRRTEENSGDGIVTMFCRNGSAMCSAAQTASSRCSFTVVVHWGEQQILRGIADSNLRPTPFSTWGGKLSGVLVVCRSLDFYSILKCRLGILISRRGRRLYVAPHLGFKCGGNKGSPTGGAIFRGI